jgi:transcription initiation factor TFIIIB Brf1 subunit/transcription initiation factor TFIIB
MFHTNQTDKGKKFRGKAAAAAYAGCSVSSIDRALAAGHLRVSRSASGRILSFYALDLEKCFFPEPEVKGIVRGRGRPGKTNQQAPHREAF